MYVFIVHPSSTWPKLTGGQRDVPRGKRVS
jgi:hypothetical protein